MEVMDEKTNGTPVIEIEETVPVTNRAYHHYHDARLRKPHCLPYHLQMTHLRQSTCQTWDRM